MNFTTSEGIDNEDGHRRQYVVFFQVLRDLKRKRRLLLQVQSAYMKEAIRRRPQERRKVSFFTILKATNAGKKLKA
ncbi:hypothetical protein CDL60_09055 [Roseateles noduli]|nr:hypothetical protein CDL60_09055 [Roseateles noduli]